MIALSILFAYSQTHVHTHTHAHRHRHRHRHTHTHTHTHTRCAGHLSGTFFSLWHTHTYTHISLVFLQSKQLDDHWILVRGLLPLYCDNRQEQNTERYNQDVDWQIQTARTMLLEVKWRFLSLLPGGQDSVPTCCGGSTAWRHQLDGQSIRRT